jgi:uncharacterized protein YndB with AHSA1/START domain
MSSSPDFHLDPARDLMLSRDVDVLPDAIWRCWTTPELLMPWFCPKPWRVTECEIDLRPGGRFFTLMKGPAGESFPNAGCFLEVDPALHRLVFTSALEPSFRPAPRAEGGPPPCTCTVVLAPHGDHGARYTAIARHATEADAKAHAAMGFEPGWAAALAQLVTFVKTGTV